MSSNIPESIHVATDYIKSIIGFTPEVGIVLGSGLGSLADHIENPVCIPYKDIPGFPVSTAIGHKSQFILGDLGGKKVIAMQGRFHYYEGYDMEQVTRPVRVMKCLGIKCLFLTNAAGGLNLDYKIGDLMIITDHISFIPNPLIGPNMDEFGPRFPDMTHAYDTSIISLAEEIAGAEGIKLHKGVYVGCTGPSYETPAEYVFFRRIGGDAVGMSTIPEVIVARHSDIPCFAMSVITDLAREDMPEDYKIDGRDIVEAADKAAGTMTRLIEKIIRKITLL